MNIHSEFIEIQISGKYRLLRNKEKKCNTEAVADVIESLFFVEIQLSGKYRLLRNIRVVAWFVFELGCWWWSQLVSSYLL